MNYIALGAACLLFSLQFIFSKWYQLRMENSLKAAVWMIVFESIWLFALIFTANGFSLQISPISAIYAVAYSCFAVICNVAAMFAMRYGKLAVVSLYILSGGIILPIIYGVLSLGESISVQKGIGLGLIFLSFFPTNLHIKESTTEKQIQSHKFRSFLLYVTVFICNGMISVVTKAHSINSKAVPEKDFLIFIALLQLVEGLLLIGGLTIFKKSSTELIKSERPNILKQILPLFLIIGGYAVCNGFANTFSMITAKTMDSSLQFPIISAVVLVLTALISWAIYKEKPTTADTVGIGLTISGIVFMIGL